LIYVILITRQRGYLLLRATL